MAENTDFPFDAFIRDCRERLKAEREAERQNEQRERAYQDDLRRS